MIGPGKYDDVCGTVRAITAAKAAIVIILGGRLGSGFSVQGPPALVLRLPEMLRRMAAQIEANAEALAIEAAELERRNVKPS